MANKKKEQIRILGPEDIGVPSGNGGDGEEQARPQSRNAPMLGTEDLFMGGSRGPAFNLGKELLEGSDDPTKYMVRTQITEDGIETYKQIAGIIQRVRYHLIDPLAIYKDEWHLYVSVNRKGREEAVEVGKAESKMRLASLRDRITGQSNTSNRPMPGGNL